MEKEKQCKNCTHFISHYIKFNNQFHQTDGHCANRKPSGHVRKTERICDCFEEKNLKEEIKKEIKSTTEWLSIVADRLNNLIQIFKLLIERQAESF